MDTSFVLNEYADVWILLLVSLWTLPWKGIALWKAAQNKSKVWFIAILILNTLAVVEILYIFIFSKRGNKKMHADGISKEVLTSHENN